MKIYGIDVPKPCVSFAHFGFDESLLAAISRSDFTTPTAIQSQAVPVALSGRDIIGIAATGSGKTLAYVWPFLVHAMDQPELQKGEGPIGLILAPTRELALQIAKEAKRYAQKVYKMRVFALTGGANKADQWKALRAGVDLLIATPVRLFYATLFPQYWTKLRCNMLRDLNVPYLM
jgi:ATP-dependent RNA helicase DDX42